MSKLIDHFKRYRFVLSELVKKGIVLRYRRSYLGVFWSLLEPLLTSIVLYYVFSALFHRGGDNELETYSGLTFMVYILVGRLVYTFFNQSTKECTRVIRQNSALIKKVHIPKYLFPLSNIIFNYILFLISLIVLAIVGGALIIFGNQPMFSWRIIQIALPLFNLVLITFGMGLILSTIGVFFRDMEYLWNVFMMLMFYACAIFYPISKIENGDYTWVATIMKLNPLYCIITNCRECLTASGIMSYSYVLYSFVCGIVLIAFGAFIFRKNEDKFILHV